MACKLCFHGWMLRKGGCLPPPAVAERVNVWWQNSSETNYFGSSPQSALSCGEERSEATIQVAKSWSGGRVLFGVYQHSWSGETLSWLLGHVIGRQTTCFSLRVWPKEPKDFCVPNTRMDLRPNETSIGRRPHDTKRWAAAQNLHKITSNERMQAILHTLQCQLQYHHHNDELSLVHIKIVGMGVKRVRMANLPSEEPDRTIRDVFSNYGDVKRITEEIMSKVYKYPVSNGIRVI